MYEKAVQLEALRIKACIVQSLLYITYGVPSLNIDEKGPISGSIRETFFNILIPRDRLDSVLDPE